MGAASCQPQGFRCIHTGAHLPDARWAPRLPVLADQAEGKKVPTGQASGANMQVPTGQAPGAQVPADLAQGMQVPGGQAPGATMQVPAGQSPGANLQVPTTGQAPGVQVPAGSAPDIIERAIRMDQPMGSGHPSKASHSQWRPGPKSGVGSWLKIFLTATLLTRTHNVRVPALSAGAGGSSTFVHAVSQQVIYR